MSVQLLYWYFRQAVLANMRGAGEPVIECDEERPRLGAEHMEFELFSHLPVSILQFTVKSHGKCRYFPRTLDFVPSFELYIVSGHYL